MDVSLPIQLSSASATIATPSQSGDNPWEHLLGEYIGLGIASDTKRSLLGHSGRLKKFGEGAVFSTFKTSIREYHAEGGFSATPVALKLLRGCPMGESPLSYPYKDDFRTKQLTAIVREMKVLGIAASSKQQHVVHLHQWGFSTVGGPNEDMDDPQWVNIQPYLILEFADCGTLQQFSSRPEIVETGRDLALDVVSGLEFLHENGIAHGDLKLENVLVFTHPERRFTAKISDFSHSIFEESPPAYLGTARCCPPEVSQMTGSDITFIGILRCDIWALGVAVFELLTGREFGPEFTLESSDKGAWRFDLMPPVREGMLAKDPEIWGQVLSMSLCVDAQKRGTLAQIRELLDAKGRCNNSLGLRLRRLTPPTVLEVMARNRIYDEKIYLHKWQSKTAVYGPKSTRSYYYLQGMQKHFLGAGHEPDYGKAIFALMFAMKESDEPTDPLAPTLALRLLGTETGLRGHGPKARIAAQACDELAACDNEKYYSERFRVFRALTIKQTLSTNVTVDGATDLSFSDLGAKIKESMFPASVGVKVELVDLELPARLPLAHFLCLVGDLGLLKLLAENEPAAISSSAIDSCGNTCLHYASMGGHADVVEFLVDAHNADVGIANADGTTALHWLPFFEESTIPKMGKKLAGGNALNASTRGCLIPLHLVHLRGTPLHWSVSCRNLAATVQLLDLGADINATHEGQTALSLAVQIHAYDIAQTLMHGGADFLNIGPHRRSAMHFLAGDAPILRRQCIHSKAGCAMAVKKTIQVLESYGCDINSRDYHDNTPLHKAVASPLERGDYYVLRALLQSGADRNAQNASGDTPIHIAAKLSFVDRPADKQLIRLLMDDELAFHDVPFNTRLRDAEGRTISMVVAFIGKGDVIGKVIQLTKEDIFDTDNNGNHALDLMQKEPSEKFSYLEKFLQMLKTLGLTVGLHPDCS